MLDVNQIRKLFRDLNRELKKLNVMGEVGICGGAVMCLVFKSRAATKDIDGIFHPTREMRRAIHAVAKKYDLPENWLNDAAKVYFHPDPPQEDVLNLSHLRVWAPPAQYMLAMKCVSARFDSQDRMDAIFLIQYLKLRNPEEVCSLIEKYYPHRMVPAKTKFFVEEILERKI